MLQEVKQQEEDNIGVNNTSNRAQARGRSFC